MIMDARSLFVRGRLAAMLWSGDNETLVTDDINLNIIQFLFCLSLFTNICDLLLTI
jgi:hypothetical protein